MNMFLAQVHCTDLLIFPLLPSSVHRTVLNSLEGVIILEPLLFKKGSWNVNPRFVEGLKYSWILRSLIVS